MTIVLANRMDDLVRLTDAVSAFADAHGLHAHDSFELALVLEEIFTNIVKYAYDTPAGHAIEVALEQRDGVLHVEVSDSGRPFDPRSIPPPDLEADVEHRPIGGLGLHLIRKLTEELAYERRAGINHLSFRKTLRQADGD